MFALHVKKISSSYIRLKYEQSTFPTFFYQCALVFSAVPIPAAADLYRVMLVAVVSSSLFIGMLMPGTKLSGGIDRAAASTRGTVSGAASARG